MVEQRSVEEIAPAPTFPPPYAERLASVETYVAGLATKEGLEKLKADLTWRITIAMSVLTAMFVAVIELRGM